uniref:Deacetylase sirtuin-type domain-containing protein n=1 Tax=Hyaloperonospora arabidopsidis (strain Emoy2) TaxID=559515 RepID=M4BLU2_HYAAE
MGNRNRSVSMNVHSSAPPSKKQRASDDELEQATLPCAPLPGGSSVTNETDAITASTEASDQVSDGTDAPDVEAGQNGDSGSPLLTSVPSFGRDMNFSDDESDVSEETFSKWLVEQKSAGIPASQMLDTLGLGVSEGVAVDDDELWQVMLSMGIRLVKPSLSRPRAKLDTVNTLQDVALLLRSSKKIVVLAGAGISVSCGIPDFRSENGIYSVRSYDVFLWRDIQYS